jgi:phage terminase Nu1 subunit (DNA packaging protein)
VTRPHLAELLGVNALTISRWEAHDGLPAAVPGGPGRSTLYDVPAVIRWYVERAVQAAHRNGHGPGASDRPSLDVERAKLAEAQRRRTDLDIRQREGELVPLTEITPVIAEMLATVRARFLAQPAALAESLTAAAKTGGARAVESLLRERQTEALRELADWRPPGQKRNPA